MCAKDSMESLLSGVKVREIGGMPESAPRSRNEGIWVYLVRRSDERRDSTQRSAMSGVFGFSLLRETAFLRSVRGVTATRAFMEMAGGLVVAAHGLVPIDAEGSSSGVDEFAVFCARTSRFLLAVPEMGESAFADSVLVATEADRAGGER